MDERGTGTLADVREAVLQIARQVGRTRIAEWRIRVRSGGERLDARLLGLGAPGMREERLLIARLGGGGFVLTHCGEDLADRIADRLRTKDAAH